MIGKHFQSSRHTLTQPNSRLLGVYVAIFVVDVRMAGSSTAIEGREVIMHRDSPTQGRTVLPKMLIKPPLRNCAMRYVNLEES